MLEFIFFHESPTSQFFTWLQQQGISAETEQQEESYIVTMTEEIEDELYDRIEEKYDALFEMNEQLMKDEDDTAVHTANIAVYLQDGRTSYAEVDPRLLGRVIAAISAEELGQIVKAVVTAVENPQEKTCCQLQAEINDSLSK